MEREATLDKQSKEELTSIILSMEENVEKTHSDYLEIEKRNIAQDKRIASLQQHIRLLTEALQLSRQRQFGRKTERFENDEQLRLFNEAHMPENVDAIETTDELISVAGYDRPKKRGRKGLPADWPRVEKIYDLSDEEKQCGCGQPMHCFGEQRTEQLELIPAQKYVLVHVEKKYVCHTCEGSLKQGKKAPPPIPKRVAGPCLLAHVLTSKFQDHLPLYRQEQMFRRLGIPLERNTLSLWVMRCAQLRVPLENLMLDEHRNYDIAYADETKLRVLDEPNTLSWMWLFIGGPSNKHRFIYRYAAARSHEIPLNYFEGFTGYLHCDGYSSYGLLAKKRPDITLVGCMYHARRQFMAVAKLTKKKKGMAHQVLKIIQQLSVIEKTATRLPADEAYTLRQEEAKPVLETLHAFLKEKQPVVPPKRALGQAIYYTLNQWKHLIVYCEDGRLDNNNNRSERAIKPFAIGRKNGLFNKSVKGAIAAARLYSFIETCKHHGIEPYYWFAAVLSRIRQCQTVDDYEALLPYNIDKSLLDPRHFMPHLDNRPLSKPAIL